MRPGMPRNPGRIPAAWWHGPRRRGKAATFVTRVHQHRPWYPDVVLTWHYDDLYCARGQNLIKRHKSQLASDRTSCCSPLAIQRRLILPTAALGARHRPIRGHDDRNADREPICAVSPQAAPRRVRKTCAQVALAWAVQRGTAFLTASTKPNHIQENLEVSALPEDAIREIREGITTNVRFKHGSWDRRARLYSPSQLS
jgi:hypothetical protein